MFSIGVGPSSSHTVGPMRAAYAFVNDLRQQDLLIPTHHVHIDLYGSLALTGMGHGTDKAVLMGLENDLPESIDPFTIESRLEDIKNLRHLNLGAEHDIILDYAKDLVFHQHEFLPKHANAMRFSAFDAQDECIFSDTYYSIGGGFIANEANFGEEIAEDKIEPPYPFNSAAELIALCKEHQLTIADIMRCNEKTWRTETEIETGMLNLAKIMSDCIQAGCESDDSKRLPGGLNVKRRAPKLFGKLEDAGDRKSNMMNWLNLYALAVNEENAAGGRVVTAPTNGAAGIIPAVLQYYKEFCADPTDKGVVDFLLTAAAIGILYKKNASISAAEVGCQGEVGVACSMAAGALAAVLGGSVDQVEKAAEMGMEHHLGLTCDPIQGLVQIPCIERNAMGTVQAVSCANLAISEDDAEHHVTLDQVIDTMFRTGKDMQSQYKETSLGGLAVNLPEC
tara:strand:- start:118720 stop:120072 length:1353 start_codon:yes stop_codon:yes gene_type:complete